MPGNLMRISVFAFEAGDIVRGPHQSVLPASWCDLWPRKITWTYWRSWGLSGKSNAAFQGIRLFAPWADCMEAAAKARTDHARNWAASVRKRPKGGSAHPPHLDRKWRWWGV